VSPKPRAEGRRILLSAGGLALAVFGGLAAGALVGVEGGASRIGIPALALQTFLTVGALPRRRGSAGVREGVTLTVIHYTVATLPLALVAVIVGPSEPIGFGLLLVAISPPAALIPAFAARVEADVRSLLAFCLFAYAVALVLTPAILLLVAGSTVGVAAIATTVGAGLIAPSLLGRMFHERIVRVRPAVRRWTVNVAVFFITVGVGGELLGGLRSAGIGLVTVALVALAITLRSFGSGWLCAKVAPRDLVEEAPFAGGFKNVALAAAVGGALAGPTAALPGLVGFVAETLYYLWLAVRRASAAARRGS
jgi:hypothetical protein